CFRALRSECAGRHAAAVRERRHRGELVPEVRQPGEGVVAGSYAPIDADIELILVVHLVADTPVVVRGPARGWEGIPIQERPRHRVDPAGRDRVVRERASDWTRVRVVNYRHTAADGLREHALPLERRGDGRDHGPTDGLSLTLIVGKEEGAVALKRPTEHTAELLAAETRLGGTRGREEIARVQRFVPHEL